MKKSDNSVLFSVVTICYNAETTIKKTIESVLAQDSANFEYVLKDGGSKDNTLTIINGYADKFKAKGIRFFVTSGKDNGIYDAMNIAVNSCEGEYVLFMNSDDCFYSASVLSDVEKSLNQSSTDKSLPDIVFGDCIVKELGMYFKFRKCPDQIETRMPFSHQACFAKRTHLLKWPLDLKYPITADYDFLMKCHMNNCTFFDSNVIISLVTADGVSSVNMYDAFSEACKVCESYGKPRYTESEMKKKIAEMKIKQFVLDCFPAFIKKAIRQYQVNHRGQILEVTIPEWAK